MDIAPLKSPTMGSSPLARGLLRRLPRFLPARGIIPARAGFTHLRQYSYQRPPDHPRSRGVYKSSHTTMQPVLGSSPLARGLPGHDLPLREIRGIIPARAGFTFYVSVQNIEKRDHPRSRGVYHVKDRPDVRQSGSSPLARGLRGREYSHTLLQGIIPARAGFTTIRDVSSGPLRDHPRSRGVYRAHMKWRKEFNGSSPLARGLRPQGQQDQQGHGIIPARAGFTTTYFHNLAYDGDHPRSRGVYIMNSSKMIVVTGSSPLARGLLCEIRVHDRH